MKRFQPYHSLVVYQEGVIFVKNVYRVTEKFPKYEIFGITSQLRRAAVSGVANIVEGHAKKSWKDRLRFFEIAKASLRECVFYIELVEVLGYLTSSEAETLEDSRRKTNYLLDRYMEKLSIEQRNFE
ncbi:MAG: four helix bundle protein [Candidatus Uhrbacteria bacterium]